MEAYPELQQNEEEIAAAREFNKKIKQDTTTN